MFLLRPNKFAITQHLHIPVDADGLMPPSNDKDEWNQNHRQYILHVLLPSIRPPLKTWKACIEAYLTNVEFENDHPDIKIHGNPIKKGDIYSFEEILCDGSSVVPDVAYRWGNIKDPWGTAHDFIYTLNHLGYLDAFGHKWKLLEAHSMYRDGWIAEGFPLIGWTWWTGLVLGGWKAWYSKDKDIEPITGWKYYETGCKPFSMIKKNCC